MSEWSTYRLSSFLLFSPRTYLRLHELYNADVWPLQLVALALGLVIVAFAAAARPWSGRTIALVLGLCWLFVAWTYHLRRYATINWAATYFAAAFALEAVLLAWVALRTKVSLGDSRSVATRIGIGAVLFALFVQPLLGVLTGRAWSQSQFFGIAPDPTVVATLGVLVATQRSGWLLWVVPLAWCAVAGAFASMMKLPDALVMPLAAAVALAVRLSTKPANVVDTRR